MPGPEYSELPERAKKVIANFVPDEEKIDERVRHCAGVQPRENDNDGDQEVLDGVTFTHHFVDAPGDQETDLFRYVEAGAGEPIVFLHGVPDSWYQWPYPGIDRAVPRYFNSSTFRQESLERRNRLLAAWKCPVMVIQGYESKSQPREFYQKARDYIPNAASVAVEYVDAGHFWSMEQPDHITQLIKKLLAM
jgi:pimeloyl-ACP methyl ester carboxylesterase